MCIRDRCNPYRKVLPGYQLEHQEAKSFCLLETIDGADAGVIERGQEPRFALEARQPVGILRDYFGEYLEGNVTTEPGITGAIHLAHSTGADLLDDLVVAELFRYHGDAASIKESAGPASLKMLARTALPATYFGPVAYTHLLAH